MILGVDKAPVCSGSAVLNDSCTATARAQPWASGSPTSFFRRELEALPCWQRLAPSRLLRGDL